MTVLVIDAVMPFDVPVEIASEKPVAFQLNSILEGQETIGMIIVRL